MPSYEKRLENWGWEGEVVEENGAVIGFFRVKLRRTLAYIAVGDLCGQTGEMTPARICLGLGCV